MRKCCFLGVTVALVVGSAPMASAHGPDGGTLLAWGLFGNSSKSNEDPVNAKGRIVFASTALPAESAPAKGQDAFKAGEPIHGRLYLTEPLQKVLGSNAFVRKVFLDDTEVCFQSGDKLPKEVLAAKSLGFTLVLEPGGNTDDPLVDNPFWVYCATKLSEKLTPGKHTVKVRFPCSFPTEATFKLDVTSEGLANMRKIAADTESAFRAGKTAKVELPSASISDKALEADFIQAVKDDKFEGTPLKAIITSPDWEIARHKVTGVVLSRTLGGVVAIKRPNGKCFLHKIAIQQPWDGAKYGKSRYGGAGEATEIDCAKVK